MARGWESKSVEAQQAEAMDNKRSSRSALTPEQASRKRHVDGLLLSRKRVLQQLEAARDPRHRQILQRALADLDGKIQEIR